MPNRERIAGSGYDAQVTTRQARSRQPEARPDPEARRNNGSLGCGPYPRAAIVLQDYVHAIEAHDGQLLPGLLGSAARFGENRLRQ